MIGLEHLHRIEPEVLEVAGGFLAYVLHACKHRLYHAAVHGLPHLLRGLVGRS